jgi:hypothetical protein
MVELDGPHRLRGLELRGPAGPPSLPSSTPAPAPPRGASGGPRIRGARSSPSAQPRRERGSTRGGPTGKERATAGRAAPRGDDGGGRGRSLSEALWRWRLPVHRVLSPAGPGPARESTPAPRPAPPAPSVSPRPPPARVASRTRRRAGSCWSSGTHETAHEMTRSRCTATRTLLALRSCANAYDPSAGSAVILPARLLQRGEKRRPADAAHRTTAPPGGPSASGGRARARPGRPPPPSGDGRRASHGTEADCTRPPPFLVLSEATWWAWRIDSITWRFVGALLQSVTQAR